MLDDFDDGGDPRFCPPGRDLDGAPYRGACECPPGSRRLRLVSNLYGLHPGSGDVSAPRPISWSSSPSGAYLPGSSSEPSCIRRACVSHSEFLNLLISLNLKKYSRVFCPSIAQFAQLGSNSDAHEHRVWFEAAAPNSEAPVCPQTLGIVVQHHLFVHFPKQISEFHSPLESGSVGYMVPRVNAWLNRWIEVGRPVPKEAILYLHTASRRSSASARRCR